LGTRWWIDILNEDTELKNKIIDRVNDFESKYSRFKITSELYKLNKNKIYENPDQEFIKLLNYALKMYETTDGLFNISVGGQLESDGYGRVTKKGAIISDDLLKDLMVNDQQIKLSSHTTLDFGGFGKGWLIDELGKIIKKHGIKDFIINGGGDILVGNDPQEILIEHPLKPGFSIQKIVLKNQSLASSSSLKRRWKSKDNQLKSHIINPVKQQDNDVLSMHVIADSALVADTLATVFLITNEIKRKKISNQFNVNYIFIK
jgi:thiamine biosynthesis lipoprotein